MIYLMLLFLEITVLFFLSRVVSRTLSLFLPIRVLSLLFLPGVIVHELSHMLAAGILLVRVGDIEFRPKIADRGMKLGSVTIAKTDPIRRAIIGFAPVFVGLLMILGLMYFQFPFSSFWGGASATTPESVFWRFWTSQNDGVGIKLLMSAITLYLLFVISNTMFSSRADMEGTLELLIVLLVIFGAFYFVGFRLPSFFIEYLFRPEVIRLIQRSSIFLLAPIAIDLVILGTIKLFYKR